jgi:hypothetical protein
MKADFQKFGLDVETKRFSELRPMLDTDIVGKWCEVTKKPQKDNPQYSNVYINSMIDLLGKTKQSDIYNEAKTTALESKDDIPF